LVPKVRSVSRAATPINADRMPKFCLSMFSANLRRGFSAISGVSSGKRRRCEVCLVVLYTVMPFVLRICDPFIVFLTLLSLFQRAPHGRHFHLLWPPRLCALSSTGFTCAASRRDPLHSLVLCPCSRVVRGTTGARGRRLLCTPAQPELRAAARPLRRGPHAA
jgi:hypothetical protein